MTRGLPFSIVFHILVTALVLVYGNAVNRTPPRPVRSINVQMVRLPETRPVEQPAERPADPVPRQPEPEAQPELPPKEKPEPEQKKPEPKTEPEKAVEPVQPEVSDEPPAEAEPEPTPALMVSGPSVTTDDADFPFAWYAQRVEGLVWRNFKPRQINFGRNAMISCAVHFKIGKNGAVSQVTLVRNSGVGVFDREALRAVQTSKLPPLPPQYHGTSLGVTFIFNLEPGS